MLNAIGLQNPGVDVVANDYAPRWTGWTVPMIVNGREAPVPTDARVSLLDFLRS